MTANVTWATTRVRWMRRAVRVPVPPRVAAWSAREGSARCCPYTEAIANATVATTASVTATASGTPLTSIASARGSCVDANATTSLTTP